MSTTELKTDHSVGAGMGAAAGAASGATLGAATGLIGAAIGAVIGGVGGAKAGDGVAEFLNPTEFDAHWRANYTKADYHNADLDWDDYAPAYGLGYFFRDTFRGNQFDDLDDKLEAAWNKVKGQSKLAWDEARDAARDGWHHVERVLPGDFDNDSE